MGEDSGLQMSEDQRAAKVKDVGRVRLWDKPSSLATRRLGTLRVARDRATSLCEHNLFFVQMTKTFARFQVLATRRTSSNVHTQRR